MRLTRRLVRTGTLLGAVGVYLAPLAGPALRRAPAGGWPDLDTAEAELRRRALTGWTLVEAARDLVADQFCEYSAMTPWLSPAEAFGRRRGHSPQYNLALAELLRRLDVDVVPVFAARIHEDAPRPWWRNAHVWLWVTVDGRTHDVCAVLSDGVGRLRFDPVTEVLPFGRRTRVNTAAVLTLAAAWQQWRHLLTGRALPRWMERPLP